VPAGTYTLYVLVEDPEKLKYTITTSGNIGELQLEWENHIASVSIRAT
jgi:hypothetical protein